MMKTKRKILWAFCAALFLLVSVSVGLIWYAYSHPLLIKTWVEEVVSSSIGATLTIEELEYSLDPLRIRGKGIRLSSGEKLKGSDFFIPDFSAEFFLEGPFGNRVLICKSIALKEFSGRLRANAAFLQGDDSLPISSSGGGILSRLISIFLFRDVKIQQMEIANGQMAYQAGDLEIRLDKIQSHLNADHAVELVCSIDGGWPAKNVKLAIPQISLKTDGLVSFGNSGTVCSLIFENGDFETPEGSLHGLDAKANLFYQHNLGKLAFSGLTIGFKKAVLKEGYTEKNVLSGFSLTSEGEIDLKNHTLRADPVELEMADLFQLKGKFHAGLGAPRRFQWEVSKGKVFPGRLLPLFAGKIAPFSATVSGPILLAGVVTGLEEDGKWGWDCALNSSFEENKVSLVQGENRFQGKLSGEAEVKGRYPHLKEAVRLQVREASFSGNGALLQSFDASVSFTGAYPLYRVDDFSARIPRADITSGKNVFALSKVAVKGKGGSVNVGVGAVSFPEIFFDSSLLKNIRISLKSGPDGTAMEITGEETGLFQSVRDLGWFPQGWTFEGRDRIEIKADLKKSGECSVVSQIVFPAVSFLSPNGDRAGEKISLKLELGGKTDLSFERVAFDTSISVEKGEVLWDRFYLALSDHPMKVHCEGLYESAGRNLRLSGSALNLQGILGVSVDGDIFKGGYGQGLDLRLTIPVTPVEPLFRHFVKEPFRMEKPGFAGLALDGEISADLRLKTDPVNQEVKGRILWRDGLLFSPDHGILLKEIDLSIPVWYRTRSMGRSSEQMEGNLHIGSFGIPFLPKQPLKIKLMAGPNRISVDAPTVLMVPGGEVLVPSIRAQNVFSPDLSLDTGISMDDLPMEPLLTGIWPHPIQGSISGMVEPIHLEKGHLSTGGAVIAQVFGGEIILSHAGASGLFGSAPVFKLNAMLKDLALLKLTSGTSFGEIEGVLNGSAENIEISNGQLQRFNLLLETTKEKGVSQKISVKAVDNIASLGGGQSPFVGVAGMFMSFFKEFPYEKIGIRATLENDVFRINGTIRDGEKEYLIKRGFLSGVDVINQNRDNVVSFKDMLKRIKRISASKGGPVIR